MNGWKAWTALMIGIATAFGGGVCFRGFENWQEFSGVKSDIAHAHDAAEKAGKKAEECCDTAAENAATIASNREAVHQINESIRRIDENIRYYMRQKGVAPIAEPSTPDREGSR